MLTPARRRALMAVARGEAPADLVIRNAVICNVYSGELWPAHVAILGDRIAYVGQRPPAAHAEWDAGGRFLAPGLVEPHAHPQVLYNPATLLEGVVPRGTTTLFCDDGPFAADLTAVDAVLASVPGNVWWLVRYAPPTLLPGSDQAAAALTPEAALARLSRPAAAATMEFGRWPALYRGDAPYLEVHTEALHRRRRVEGHLSGASAERLPALVVAGVTADHEPITAAEVVDRLRLGLWVMLRHSSLRPDLPELLAAVTRAGVDTSRLMFTTDGATAAFIEAHGFQDEMLRIAVAAGVPPVRALQMASLNPAVYYGVEGEVGGIAPGRRADLMVLPDLTGFRPERVMVGGRWVVVDGRPAVPWPRVDWGLVSGPAEWAGPDRFADPALYPARHADGEPFPVLEFVNAVITRRRDLPLPAPDGRVVLDGAPGLIHVALVDRSGGWIVRGVAAGLVPGVAGLASSQNVAGQLLVLGRDPAAMALAARRVAELRGGMVLVEGNRVVWEFPLPVLGQMSDRPFAEVAAAERELTGLLRERGYAFHDPVYSLMFIPFDGLPRLRLTPAGIYEVLTERVLRPREPFAARP